MFMPAMAADVYWVRGHVLPGNHLVVAGQWQPKPLRVRKEKLMHFWYCFPKSKPIVSPSVCLLEAPQLHSLKHST
jgi:hypothetical protein